MTQDHSGKPRVLVVDDQAFVANVILLSLGARGYDIMSCLDPLEVLDNIDQWQPDLAIIDVCMPSMSGTELCQRLRRREATSALPIIILTAQGQSAAAEAAVAAGADAFMTKPFSPRALAAKIEELLGSGGAADTVAAGP